MHLCKKTSVVGTLVKLFLPLSESWLEKDGDEATASDLNDKKAAIEGAVGPIMRSMYGSGSGDDDGDFDDEDGQVDEL